MRKRGDNIIRALGFIIAAIAAGGTAGTLVLVTFRTQSPADAAVAGMSFLVALGFLCVFLVMAINQR